MADGGSWWGSWAMAGVYARYDWLLSSWACTPAGLLIDQTQLGGSPGRNDSSLIAREYCFSQPKHLALVQNQAKQHGRRGQDGNKRQGSPRHDIESLTGAISGFDSRGGRVTRRQFQDRRWRMGAMLPRVQAGHGTQRATGNTFVDDRISAA